MWRALGQFVADESGQDVIEYALLTAFIGVVGILIWQNVGTGIRSAYAGWDTGVQSISSVTPDPLACSGGGC